MEKKNKGGQPLKFASVKELQNQIDDYFTKCENADEPVTITGLALALKTNRQTLLNYEDREKYFDTIKTAKTRVEHYAEKKLFTGTPTGAIFALKNFGWSDKHEIDTSIDAGTKLQELIDKLPN